MRTLRERRRGWLGRRLATLLAFLATAACRLGDERIALAPDFILNALDTLRAGRLGWAGYSRPTTPDRDRFRQDAVVLKPA